MHDNEQNQISVRYCTNLYLQTALFATVSQSKNHHLKADWVKKIFLMAHKDHDVVSNGVP